MAASNKLQAVPPLPLSCAAFIAENTGAMQMTMRDIAIASARSDGLAS